MIKKCTFLIGALVAVMALGVGAATAQPKAEQVTLKFQANAENRVGWDLMIKNFQNAYPDIKIDASYAPITQYDALLLTQIQAGNPPDLFSTRAGASAPNSTWALGFQGKLLDLTPKNPWWKRQPKAARRFVTVKQKIYSFTSGIAPNGMIYNKDVFKSLGLTVPKTFPELLSLCGKVKAAGKTPIVAGMAGLTAPVILASNVITEFVYNKDPNWTLERNQKKVTFAGSPLWKRAMQAIVQMRDGGCFQPSPQGMTSPVELTTMASGQAAMLNGSVNLIPRLQALNPDLHLGMFAFPADQAKDTQAQITTSALHLAASANTQHPNEAKTFINFIARPKQNSVYCKVQGCIAPDDWNKAILPDYMSDFAPLLKSGQSAFSPVTDWPRPDKGLFIPNLYTQVVGLFTGQRTPDQILEFMDALWDKP